MGRTLFVAGHAKLPQGMAAQSVFGTLSITLEVDRKYGVIVEASCTLATDHGKEFLARLLRGYSLKDSIDEVIEVIHEHYVGKAANALIAAYKDAHTQFALRSHE